MNNGNNMPSQPLRDRVLWVLTNSNGKMERSQLRRRMAMKYVELDPILKRMEKEGRISWRPLPTGKEMIILKDK